MKKEEWKSRRAGERESGRVGEFLNSVLRILNKLSPPTSLGARLWSTSRYVITAISGHLLSIKAPFLLS